MFLHMHAGKISEQVEDVYGKITGIYEAAEHTASLRWRAKQHEGEKSSYAKQQKILRHYYYNYSAQELVLEHYQLELVTLIGTRLH